LILKASESTLHVNASTNLPNDEVLAHATLHGVVEETDSLILTKTWCSKENKTQQFKTKLVRKPTDNRKKLDEGTCVT
jgi:hypothetical protein